MTAASLTNINAGERLPDVQFGPISRKLLALYAGASGDHNPIHIDLDYARAAGLSDVFAHGMLSFGVLAQVVTRWAGMSRLRAFSARFVAITNVHDVITCTGSVAERFEQDGERRVRVIIAASAQDGRQTLVGEAIVCVD
jgi:acyl dehydratase